MLIHGEHRHPVRRRVSGPEPLVGMTHGVGKRPATRHDQQRLCPRGVLDAPQCRLETFCMSQKPAAEFHDGLDVRTPAAVSQERPASDGRTLSARVRAAARRTRLARIARRRRRSPMQAAPPSSPAARAAALGEESAEARSPRPCASDRWRAATRRIAVATSSICASASAPAIAEIAASSSISRSAQTTRARRSPANSRVAGRPSGVGDV